MRRKVRIRDASRSGNFQEMQIGKKNGCSAGCGHPSTRERDFDDQSGQVTQGSATCRSYDQALHCVMTRKYFGSAAMFWRAARLDATLIEVRDDEETDGFLIMVPE